MPENNSKMVILLPIPDCFMKQALFSDFPLSEYKERIARVRKKMDENDVDGLFLTTRENIEYISGFQTVAMTYPFKQFGLILPRDDDPCLVIDILHKPNAKLTSWVDNLKIWGGVDVSHMDAVVQGIKDGELSNKKVGMELGPEMRLNMTILDYEDLKKNLPKMKIVDASDLTRSVRIIKSRLELERIKKACEITCKAFKAAFETLREGMTERDFLNLIEIEMLKRGADCGYNRVEGVVHLCTGPERSGQYAAVPVDRAIKRGDFVRLDGGAQYKRYVCDVTRSFYFGVKLDTNKKRRMKALIKVHDSIPEVVKPGITSAEIVDAVLKVFRDEGVERDIVRWVTPRLGSRYIIGHNFGLTVHEEPDIFGGGKSVWRENMVFACELILGEFEEENDYLVTKDGCRLITPLEHKAEFEEGETWRVG